jgi:hypothetical protein
MASPPSPTSGLCTALATVAFILGMAYIITGITGLVRHVPTAPVLTGFGVVVSVLALWLRRWAARRNQG